MTFAQAKRTLKALDIKLERMEFGDYRVNYFKNDREETAYYTDDLSDAVEAGRRLAERGN